MCTIRCSSHLGGGSAQWEGVCLLGVCLPAVGIWSGGCLPAQGGVCACQGVYTSSPVDRIRDTRLWKHYLSATSFADGNQII